LQKSLKIFFNFESFEFGKKSFSLLLKIKTVEVEKKSLKKTKTEAL